MKETFFAGQDYDALTALAAKVPAGSEGLEWAPYLLGERTPHLDPEVRAAFVGIGPTHAAGHFVRAVLRGVAYSLQDTFTLFANGDSGERSAVGRRRRERAAVAKIQAGIYGQTVEGADGGGRRRVRLALLAGVGAGHWASLDAACGQAIEVAQRIEPDPADGAAYQAGYAQWRKVYPALHSLALRQTIRAKSLAEASISGWSCAKI